MNKIFLTLTSNRLAIFNLLVHVDASVCQILLQSPHFRSSHVLILEGAENWKKKKFKDRKIKKRNLTFPRCQGQLNWDRLSAYKHLHNSSNWMWVRSMTQRWLNRVVLECLSRGKLGEANDTADPSRLHPRDGKFQQCRLWRENFLLDFVKLTRFV